MAKHRQEPKFRHPDTVAYLRSLTEVEASCSSGTGGRRWRCDGRYNPRPRSSKRSRSG